mgnify:FL=1
MRTTLINGLVKEKRQNLLASKLCEPSQVSSALAEIGRQLQILAGVQSGGRDFSACALPSLYRPFTVSKLFNEFYEVKDRTGRSDRYLRALKYSLKKFLRKYGSWTIDQITFREIEQWLFTLHVRARTMHGYLGDLRTLFSFAVKRGYLEKNPALGVEIPIIKTEPVKIHDPDTVRKVLGFARRYDADICRALALRYFAGLRTAEIERMDDDLIGETYIEVTAAVAKGGRARKRRIVTIQPCLRAWLALGGRLPAPPQNGRRMLEFMRNLNASGIDWPHNVTRHSFCSYHLAKFQNAGKTALEAGHTEQMLFAHYRELVPPARVEEYFSIFPRQSAPP